MGDWDKSNKKGWINIEPMQVPVVRPDFILPQDKKEVEIFKPLRNL